MRCLVTASPSILHNFYPGVIKNIVTDVRGLRNVANYAPDVTAFALTTLCDLQLPCKVVSLGKEKLVVNNSLSYFAQHATELFVLANSQLFDISVEHVGKKRFSLEVLELFLANAVATERAVLLKANGEARVQAAARLTKVELEARIHLPDFSFDDQLEKMIRSSIRDYL